MKKPRGLTPEEQALWDQVRRTSDPLHKGKKPADPAPPPPQKLKQKPLPTFDIGSASKSVPVHNLAPSLPDDLASAPLNMDKKRFQNLKRGKIEPEARLDLHGMTLAEAHPELIQFVMGSAARGLRLVLVITGKGKHRDEPGPIPTRFGVLRHQVPQWLRMAPLGPVVLQVTTANQRHGGTGAYYVYLRRRR